MRIMFVLCALAIAGCDQAPGLGRKPEQAPVGRWVIIHSPHVVRDTMLVDTVTGNTWQLVKLGENEDSRIGWQFVGKLDGPSKSDEWWEEFENPSTNKS